MGRVGARKDGHEKWGENSGGEKSVAKVGCKKWGKKSGATNVGR